MSNKIIRSHAEVLGKIKDLGFAPSKHIRRYGESFEIVSEPFAEDDGIAVQAITRKDSQVRTLRLPLSVLGLGKLPMKSPETSPLSQIQTHNVQPGSRTRRRHGIIEL